MFNQMQLISHLFFQMDAGHIIIISISFLMVILRDQWLQFVWPPDTLKPSKAGVNSLSPLLI